LQQPLLSPHPTAPEKPPFRWRLNAFLFFLTVLTTFSAGASQNNLFMQQVMLHSSIDIGWVSLFPVLLFGVTSPVEIFVVGLPYAGTLLSILLFHEFGHFLYARKHHVEASLPFFIPMPLQFIGTMGAVIRMQGRIPSRNALLDIGASGPLGGLIIAIPAMIIGVSLSHVEVLPTSGYLQEGNSLLYAGVKYFWHGHIPAGSDVMLHPMAFAAWFGFFMTAMNLLPIGQLDGGHITYALLPRYHHTISRLFHGMLLASPFVLYFLVGFNGVTWGFFAIVIRLVMREFGPRHPPVEEPAPLSVGRKVIAVVSLLFFIVLLPPIPFRDVPAETPPATQPAPK
jgi:membrane-associated protease RseP (regulator of RpoE activity)